MPLEDIKMAPDNVPEAELRRVLEGGLTPLPDVQKSGLKRKGSRTLNAFRGPGPFSFLRPLRISLVHVLLAVNTLILLGGAIFLYQVFTAEAEAPAAPAAQAAAATETTPAAAQPQAQAAEEPKEGYSWLAAERAYAARQWDTALTTYSALLARSEKSAAGNRISDFLRVRIAACLRRLERPKESRQSLLAAAESGSPIVRAVACRDLALMDMAEGQHLLARMRAYQGLASLGAAAGQAALETDCEFLLAQAMTRKASSLFSTDWLPPRTMPADADPFRGLSEPELRRLLDEGADRLASAALGPFLRSIEGDRAARRWTVVASGSPVEDLVGRLVAQSGMEVKWEVVTPAARRRPVVLLIAGATDQRLIEVACGCAGLVARFTGSETLVNDPVSYTSTAVHQDLVVREAISAWRRFFLKATDDARLAYGRFSLAMLYEHSNDAGAAITEYQTIAQRHPSDRLASAARLRIATIRLEMRDFAGAREELLDLLNRYPDCPAGDEVYLRLGQATMEAGLLDEAIQTFKKLYFLDLSLRSRAGASMGAGLCYFRKGQYDEAAAWLARRVELARSAGNELDLADAYALLAKTEAARGRLPQAVQAFRRSLAVEQQATFPADGGRATLDPARRTATLLDLAHILLKQEEFASALGILESLSPKDAAPKQADEILLARAEILRSMKLSERAMGILRRGIANASSAEVAGRMTVELARCLVDSGDPDGARQALADAMPKMTPGPLAQGAAIDLAEVCLKTGRSPQVIAVCRELLKSPCPDDVRRRAQELLGTAYTREKDYPRAAMALSGTLPEGPGATKP